MIDHKNKFIFIHIPRTGGTSIEKTLHNRDWWSVHPPSKHLTVHIAKKIYAKYWKDYFKFTFVRNPWDRMVSMLKYHQIYKVYANTNKKIVLSRYFNQFEKIEYDTRFFNLSQFNDFTKEENTVYQNIIGQEMDFIGKFENLQEDFNNLCDILNIKNTKLMHIEKSKNRMKYQEYYSENERDIIAEKYQKDIKKFNYKF